MTYSRFQFLPLRVSSPTPTQEQTNRDNNNGYRLLKFTDARDPRHRHFYPISGNLIENYETQNANKRRKNHDESNNDNGRLLELRDNWCLLSRDEIDTNSTHSEWSDVPHPHRGHPVLYVPGHWGSFSQARSLGAHGTRWTGPYNDAATHQKIFESFQNGLGMHDGTQLLQEALKNDTDSNIDDENLITNLLSSPLKHDFVMDVFALDFGEEGAALHFSKILNQADFVVKAVQTIVEGCHHHHMGVTIVAHSIGALAVRASLDMNPHLVANGWVKNVINLASPLQTIPYAVDSRIHDLLQTLNEKDANNTDRDVVVVSISGGLRDELIPPNGGLSENFLASSLLEHAATTNTRFGMDHRCIVWCYELLSQVRECIFMLAAATNHGLNSSQRLNVVRKTLQTTSSASFEDEVKSLHKRAVSTKGYTGLVAIQLAAPYHLNYLLKLCILAALVHSLLLWPIFLQRRQPNQRWNESRKQAIMTRCIEVSIGLLVIPVMVTITTLLRQLEFKFLGWRFTECYMHECDLLLGTTFVLTQLSALVYFIVVYGVGFTIAKMSCKCFSFQKQHEAGRSFGTMLGHCFVQHLRHYGLISVSIAVAVVFVVTNMNTGSGVEFDILSLASTLYVAFEMLVFGCLFKLFVKPTATNLEERRMIFVILLLSLVKATYGKLVYAYSSLIHGVRRSWYDDDMLVSFASTLLPAFFAIMAVEARDKVTHNALVEWKRSLTSDNQKNGIDIDVNKTHVVIAISNKCLVIWYMLNVLVNYSGDDIVVLLYSLMTVATSYWKCFPLSTDVYSAIIEDDLLLHCEFKDKDE